MCGLCENARYSNICDRTEKLIDVLPAFRLPNYMKVVTSMLMAIQTEFALKGTLDDRTLTAAELTLSAFESKDPKYRQETSAEVKRIVTELMEEST